MPMISRSLLIIPRPAQREAVQRIHAVTATALGHQAE
jgi:hypothetical protein